MSTDLSSSEDPRKLRALLDLRDAVDDLLEDGLMERKNLAEVMRAMLPVVARACGARGAFIESYDEDLALSVFCSPEDLAVPDWEGVRSATSDAERQNLARVVGDDLIIAQPLDVAGEWFGRAGLVVARDTDAAGDPAHLAAMLNLASEELDNFLFSIRAAREKHRVMMELSDALRHRVLSQGLAEAVACLSRATPLDRLLLVYVAQEDNETTLHVQLFEGATRVVDTMSGAAIDEALRSDARAFLYGRSRALLDRYGFASAQEELLISGVTNSVRVGKVVATSKSGQFNTYDRELLAGFSGFIRQRVVDFNKDWRRLASSFHKTDVARLLSADDYERRYLAPREETVAIAYADIAGFTRISEQILRTPSAVAKLVEAWSAEAVELVWSHGGVFDKMVGDCVIALFGPPFYDRTPGECLADAIAWAQRLREMTVAFPEREGFEPLRAEGLGVTTGVNLAPLFVGTFGPNQNFTGFSSGMNNTARLQSAAKRGEILVMADALAHLPSGHRFVFGPEQSVQAKNVAEPLRYRALDAGGSIIPPPRESARGK